MKKALLILSMLCIAFLMLGGCSSDQSYYRKGAAMVEEGNYEEALIYFKKAIETNPNKADYYLACGMSLISIGDYEAAMTQFDRIYLEKEIQLVKQNNQRAHRGKGIAYYHMKEYEKALEQFQSAIRLNTTSKLDMDTLYYMGSTFLNLGNYEGAIDVYNVLLVKNRKDIEALTYRALAYEKSGNYIAALADYDKILTVEPKNFGHYFRKYDLLIAQGDVESAMEILETASQIPVKTANDRFYIAKVHYYQGDYEVALKDFNASYEEGTLEASFYMGEIARQYKKDFTTAIYYYNLFITDSKADVQQDIHISDYATYGVYNQIAYCYLKQDNPKKALEYLQEGIVKGHPETMQDLQKNEIIAYEKIGEFDMAKEKLDAYLTLYPEDVEALREEQFLSTR